MAARPGVQDSEEEGVEEGERNGYARNGWRTSGEGITSGSSVRTHIDYGPDGAVFSPMVAAVTCVTDFFSVPRLS